MFVVSTYMFGLEMLDLVHFDVKNVLFCRQPFTPFVLSFCQSGNCHIYWNLPQAILRFMESFEKSFDLGLGELFSMGN